MTDRERTTSLYRCPSCGYVIRGNSGLGGLDGLVHMHYAADGTYLGKDAESALVEFEDDGREGVIDVNGPGARWR